MVEGARLESVCRGNSTVGSNPTLSATQSCRCSHSGIAPGSLPFSPLFIVISAGAGGVPRRREASGARWQPVCRGSSRGPSSAVRIVRCVRSLVLRAEGGPRIGSRRGPMLSPSPSGVARTGIGSHWIPAISRIKTFDRGSCQSESPAPRHLPLVDILVDTQAELQELVVASGLPPGVGRHVAGASMRPRIIPRGNVSRIRPALSHLVSHPKTFGAQRAGVRDVEDTSARRKESAPEPSAAT